MKILALRTDTALASLALYQGDTLLQEFNWEAGRRLSATLHRKLLGLLKSERLTLSDVEAIVVYQGPGSFTGLRIGISAMNALAYSLNIPIIGVRGDAWSTNVQHELLAGKNHRIVQPYYGADPKTTKPRK
jgi:tRNA threonylcarbamoyladenosine biosynthesis protein TsaB